MLHSHKVLKEFWQTIIIDLIGKLPESNSFNAICIFINKLFKQMHLVPMMTKISAQGMAKLYCDNVFYLVAHFQCCPSDDTRVTLQDGRQGFNCLWVCVEVKCPVAKWDGSAYVR